VQNPDALIVKQCSVRTQRYIEVQPAAMSNHIINIFTDVRFASCQFNSLNSHRFELSEDMLQSRQWQFLSIWWGLTKPAPQIASARDPEAHVTSLVRLHRMSISFASSFST
jgi:hypothetical protein